MNKCATFGMYPDYCSFDIFNANFSQEETHRGITEQTFPQGFSGSSKSLIFTTFGDCNWITIEVWVAEPSEEIHLQPETVRAILVPFSVDRKGIKITHSLGLTEGHVYINQGNYALLFELKLNDDVQYLSSPRYQYNVKGGFTEECCRLTFYHRENFVQPEILRLDSWSTPPYEISAYTPLHPTYPLLMEI